MLNFLLKKILNVIKAVSPNEMVSVKFVEQMNTCSKIAYVTICQHIERI